MLGIQTALDRQFRRGCPGQRAEQAGLCLIPLAALARCVAGHVTGEGHLPVVFVAVVVQLVADVHRIAELQIQMGAEMAHVAVIDVVAILECGSSAVRGQLIGGHETGLVRLVVVHARDQTEVEQVTVAAVEPLAAQRVLLRTVMVAVAVGGLRGQEVVLRDTVGFASDRDLRFAGVVAAIREPRIGVGTALAGAEIDVAADVVQAVARVVGAAHDLDVVDVQRKHHVDEALVAAVDVAGNAVDQDFDAVEVALAIERAEGGLAGLRALAGFGQLHARHLAEQFPAVGDVLLMHLVAAHHIHRGQHAVRGEGTAGAFPHVHAAQGDCRITGLRARFAGAQGRQHGGHHCLGSHLVVPFSSREDRGRASGQRSLADGMGANKEII